MIQLKDSILTLSFGNLFQSDTQYCLLTACFVKKHISREVSISLLKQLLSFSEHLGTPADWCFCGCILQKGTDTTTVQLWWI